MPPMVVQTKNGAMSLEDKKATPYKGIALLGNKYSGYATQINNNFAALAEAVESINPTIPAASSTTLGGVKLSLTGTVLTITTV